NRHRRYEAITVGHPDLRQTLLVHDVGFLSDPVHVEQIRGYRVDFVGFQRTTAIGGHSAGGIIPHRGRVGPEAHRVPVLIRERSTMRVARAAHHQTGSHATFPTLPVACRALLRV